ncbi:hypothetical protein SLEP1_g39359 [Rubroshorea leprosula]|uniref:Endonuclease/exonuclease/phosphatase domain-containing protein n=1 Tax=Rubroshorea leprosula TaxID=152421 RepID=A0AAV5L0C5_9ROSI|nr:hypothetical protein SLEP1_g39359 [Rubroshorea leprosula]
MAEAQNQVQMEKRLNEMWIDYYKMRVKIANKSQNQGAVVGDSGEGEQVDVRPANVKERVREAIEPVSVQALRLVEKEEVGSCAKASAKEGKMGGVEKQHEKVIIEISPTEEELQWLEGSMVASMKSLVWITSIQDRMDVDGGLITLSPLGGQLVLLIERHLCRDVDWPGYEFQGYRCKPRMIDVSKWVLVLCSAASKVSKSIMLKVDEKLYEIEVVEEEWRSDPDWWLAEEDQRSSMSTASETHSMQSEDDGHELTTNGISNKDYDSIDVESLHKEGFLNSRLQEITACNNNANFDLPLEFGEVNGHDEGEANDEGNGLIGSDVHNGLEESIGFTKGPTNEEVRKMMNIRRRLGMQFQENEEEIESRLCVMEEQDERKGKNPGLGSMLKRKEVAKLVQVERPNFLFLQETKLEEMDEGLCGMVWHSKGFEWVVKRSIGALGGLLCVWDRMNFSKLGQFTGDGYLGIKGLWGLKKEMCYLVNVYAPTNRTKKAKLWDELRQMIMEEGGRWLIAGDFNAVHSIEERRGRTGESPDMKEFNDFIEAVGLVDHKLANRRFKCYRPDGTSMSCLDRVLMTSEMTKLGGEWVQQGLKRTISDHCAIVMKTRVSDWGPKPFRVLDVWQQHPKFKRVVEEQWNAMAMDGFAGYRCKKKLKMLKEFLQEWNKGVFGDIEAQFERAAAKVAHVHMKNEDFTLDEDEVHERQEGFQEIWDSMRKREALWRQKSRSNWVKLGDANTKFFHKIANGRKACNGIVGLLCDGQWVEEPKLVKKAAVDYVQKLFSRGSWNHPKPSGIIFKQISEEMKVWLERPFSIEEIEDGLKSCEGNKAPGPDGYNFNFIKFAWNSLKEDFVSFFGEFHQHGRFGFGVRWRRWIKECFSTAIILVLVNGSPTEEFTMGKGLRQGDPLSPFLFLMITEGLHGLVKKAETEGLIHGIDGRGRLGREKGEEVVLWEVLSRVQIMEGREDCWKWMHDAEGKYAVKKAYEFLSPMESILPDQILGGVMEFFLYELGGLVGRELGACLFLVGSWYIWYLRNIRVFQNKGECRDDLLHMIQSKTFLWIKNKVAGSVFSLFDWQFNPLECAAAIRKHRSLLREFRKRKNGEYAELV